MTNYLGVATDAAEIEILALSKSTTKTVPNVAALAALNPSAFNSVRTQGYYAPGDGGGATYHALSGPQIADGGSVIAAFGGYYGLEPIAGEVNWLQFGAIRGDVSQADIPDSADSGRALQALIAYAIAHYPIVAKLPAGYYKTSWVPGNIIGRPIRIKGDGERMTIVQMLPSVTGAFVAPVDLGFAGNSTDYVTDGTRPITTVRNAKAAFELTDLSIYGDRSTMGTQEGIILKGDCDHVSVRNVMIMQVNGRSLAAGDASPVTGLRGQIRESEIWNVKSRNCGSAGVWDFDVTLNESTSNNDSSNIVNMWGLESIFPFGGSYRINDNRTTTIGPNLYQINFRGCTAHGRFSADTFNANDLVMVNGNVAGCTLEFYLGYQMAPGLYGYRQVINPNNAATPGHGNVTLTCGTLLSAYSIEAGGVDYLKIINPFTYQHTGQVLSGATNVMIECEGNQSFLSIPIAFTLNGTNPVSIGAGSSLPGITTFFPVLPATSGGSGTGNGDTLQVMIDGAQFTLTRSGSPSNSTDTYTLTPAVSSTQAFIAGMNMSKHLVPAGQFSSTRGRFRNTPRMGYGWNAEFFKVDQSKQYQIGLSGGMYAYFTGDSGNNVKLVAPDGSGNPQTILNVLSGQGLAPGGLPIPTWGIAPTFGGYAVNATNLLQISSWRFWIDTTSATARFRYTGHAPTSLTDGLVLQSSQSQATGSEPAGPSTGEDVYDSSFKQKKTWNGSAWKTQNGPWFQDGAQYPITFATQGTTETQLGSTWTMGANQLGVQGSMEVDIIASATLNNANSKTLRLYAGSTIIWSGNLTGALSFPLKVVLQNRNASNSQVVTQASITTAGPSGNTLQTFALDTTAAITFKLTGQLSTSGDGMALERVSVRWFNP